MPRVAPYTTRPEGREKCELKTSKKGILSRIGRRVLCRGQMSSTTSPQTPLSDCKNLVEVLNELYSQLFSDLENLSFRDLKRLTVKVNGSSYKITDTKAFDKCTNRSHVALFHIFQQYVKSSRVTLPDTFAEITYDTVPLDKIMSEFGGVNEFVSRYVMTRILLGKTKTDVYPIMTENGSIVDGRNPHLWMTAIRNILMHPDSYGDTYTYEALTPFQISLFNKELKRRAFDMHYDDIPNGFVKTLDIKKMLELILTTKIIVGESVPCYVDGRIINAWQVLYDLSNELVTIEDRDTQRLIFQVRILFENMGVDDPVPTQLFTLKDIKMLMDEKNENSFINRINNFTYHNGLPFYIKIKQNDVLITEKIFQKTLIRTALVYKDKFGIDHSVPIREIIHSGDSGLPIGKLYEALIYFNSIAVDKKYKFSIDKLKPAFKMSQRAKLRSAVKRQIAPVLHKGDTTEFRIKFSQLLTKYLTNIKPCLQVYDEDKLCLMNDKNEPIITFKEQIGSKSVYGVAYLNMGIGFAKLFKFSCKIMSSTVPGHKQEIELLEKMSNLVKNHVCPNMPIVYKSMLCDRICSFKPCPSKITTTYYVVINELANSDMEYWLTKTYSRKVYESIFMQILFAVYSFHSLGYTHNDCHLGNFLVHHIKPGGCWRYQINGNNVYVPNHGYLLVLWDPGLAIPINSKPYVHDYSRPFDLIKDIQTNERYLNKGMNPLHSNLIKNGIDPLLYTISYSQTTKETISNVLTNIESKFIKFDSIVVNDVPPTHLLNVRPYTLG